MKAIRLTGIARGLPFEIEVDGKVITAYEGETLATVLLAAGEGVFAAHVAPHPSNRLFCGMGTCYQCLVTIDGQPNYQACRTLAIPGMKVETHA